MIHVLLVSISGAYLRHGQHFSLDLTFIKVKKKSKNRILRVEKYTRMIESKNEKDYLKLMMNKQKYLNFYLFSN